MQRLLVEPGNSGCIDCAMAAVTCMPLITVGAVAEHVHVAGQAGVPVAVQSPVSCTVSEVVVCGTVQVMLI